MTSWHQTDQKRNKRLSIWDDIKDDTYVRSIGGISTEWDQPYETQEWAKRKIKARAW